MTDQQKCQNCQAELPAGARFCASCGSKVEEPGQEVLKAAGEEAATAATPAGGTNPEAAPASSEAAEAAPTDQAAAEVAETAPTSADEEAAIPAVVEHAAAAEVIPAPAESAPVEAIRSKLSRFVSKPVYLYSAIAAVCVVILLAVVFSFAGSSSDKSLFYLKDNEIQHVGLKKPEPMEMTDRLDLGNTWLGYHTLAYYIFLSEDGRYVFYPDRFEYDSSTYYWRDLKAGNAADATAVKIDSEIQYVPHITKDGSKVFYIKGEEHRLYVYDRKSGDRSKLADNVDTFYVNEDGTYLVYETMVEDDYAVYEMTIKKLEGEKNKLDSYATIEWVSPTVTTVYYVKEGNLYKKQKGKDKEKIASDVDRIISVIDDKSMYYLKKEEVTTNLASLIHDDLAAADRDMTEPVYPVYPPEPLIPLYSDFTTEVWVDSYFGYERHPVTNNWGYWRQDTDYDAYNAAYDRYLEEYDAWRQEVNRIEDEYDAAYDAYQDKLFRDRLREALNDESNRVSYNQYNLYYWKEGTEELVASDVAQGGNYSFYLAASDSSPVVVYQKYSTTSGSKLKLSEVLEDNGYYLDSILYDLEYRATSSRTTADEAFAAIAGKESILESDKARRWTIREDGIYFLDDYDYDKEYGALKMIPIEKEALGKPVLLLEDVNDYRFGEGNKPYAFKDVKQGSGDLYLDGKTIATDVYIYSLTSLQGSDAILFYKDYSERNEHGTLTMYKGGKETKIADDVYGFAPIDEKSIAYLTEYNVNRERGDLMLYNGKGKPVLIDSDVTAIISFWVK